MTPNGLPEWLDPLYSPGEMRAADAFAMEERGILELELAEKAGAGLVLAVEDSASVGPIRVVVGPGNNGGDGLIAARLLRERGYEVDVLAPLPLEGLEGVPRINLDRLPGPAPRPFDAGTLQGSGAIVDALLGTGFEGSVGEPLDAVISAINRQGAPVVAADVPSGVNAETGEVEGVAVKATATSTNHAPKIGLLVGRGARHAGSVRTTDIGIPRGEPGASLAGLTSRRVLQEIPSRNDSNSGTVLVAGGSRESAGAPCLAGLAAMRAGTGRVRMAVPASIAPAVSARLPEATLHSLQEAGDGRHVAGGAEEVVRLAAQSESRPQAVVIGPGMGDSPGELSFIQEVCRSTAAPVVISAEALQAYSSQAALDELAARPGKTVLISGPGESALLLGEDPKWVGERPVATARSLADRSGSVVLLWGDNCISAAPGGPCAVSTTTARAAGAPGASGVGSTLAGLIGALLAKGLEPFPAAAAGAFSYLEASSIASERVGGVGYTIASDTIEALPEALSGA